MSTPRYAVSSPPVWSATPHLVFTLPEAINGWVEVHPEVIYDVLFASAWGTLKTFGADPKRLDGQMGMTAVLHTWGQALTRHVHLHCLAPGGALAANGTWHPAKSTYLFPVRALSRHFRGGFVSRLRLAYKGGRLPRLSGPGEVDRVLKALMAIDWVVYSKPCITHTETVVEYLGRYSHRIALSERRIVDFDGLSVWLAYKDYADGGKRKVMVLAGEELIRRFLLHVLPKGYTRVRHYGFLSNRSRKRKLNEIRAALAAPPPPRKATAPLPEWPCPVCKRGHLLAIARIPPRKRVVPFYQRRDAG